MGRAHASAIAGSGAAAVNAAAELRAKPVRRSALTTSELYEKLKEIAVLYRIRPGEHVNELELAKSFGVSRTPLREALNRLVAEGLLTFRPNRGFDVRQFEQQEIFDLYELRRYIEVAAVRLAVRRAPDAEIAALRGFWDDVLGRAADTDNEALLGLDEEFHIRLAGLSGNREMARSLQLINAKIRFVRWVEMEERRTETCDEHGVILALLAARDEAGCERELGAHIERRLEEIATAVHAGVVRLYAR